MRLLLTGRVREKQQVGSMKSLGIGYSKNAAPPERQVGAIYRLLLYCPYIALLLFKLDYLALSHYLWHIPFR